MSATIAFIMVLKHGGEFRDRSSEVILDYLDYTAENAQQ